MKRHETADQFFAAAKEWQGELRQLRTILLAIPGLEETVKWGGPVYTIDGKHVVGIGGFKSYFGLWFFQGAMLADRKKLLVNAQEGKTKALRQMRFTSWDEVDVRAIRAYVKEAVGLAKKGIEIKADRSRPVTVPAELQYALEKRRKAGERFDAMTVGKRREYAEYVESAKRDETKQRRVEKILPMIEAGVGLNDKYRS